MREKKIRENKGEEGDPESSGANFKKCGFQGIK